MKPRGARQLHQATARSRCRPIGGVCLSSLSGRPPRDRGRPSLPLAAAGVVLLLPVAHRRFPPRARPRTAAATGWRYCAGISRRPDRGPAALRAGAIAASLCCLRSEILDDDDAAIAVALPHHRRTVLGACGVEAWGGAAGAVGSPKRNPGR